MLAVCEHFERGAEAFVRFNYREAERVFAAANDTCSLCAIALLCVERALYRNRYDRGKRTMRERRLIEHARSLDFNLIDDPRSPIVHSVLLYFNALSLEFRYTLHVGYTYRDCVKDAHLLSCRSAELGCAQAATVMGHFCISSAHCIDASPVVGEYHCDDANCQSGRVGHTRIQCYEYAAERGDHEAIECVIRTLRDAAREHSSERAIAAFRRRREHWIERGCALDIPRAHAARAYDNVGGDRPSMWHAIELLATRDGDRDAVGDQTRAIVDERGVDAAIEYCARGALERKQIWAVRELIVLLKYDRPDIVVETRLFNEMRNYNLQIHAARDRYKAREPVATSILIGDLYRSLLESSRRFSELPVEAHTRILMHSFVDVFDDTLARAMSSVLGRSVCVDSIEMFAGDMLE